MAIEVEYRMKMGKDVKLSLQELLDMCSQFPDGSSFPEDAYQYAMTKGLYKIDEYGTKKKIIGSWWGLLEFDTFILNRLFTCYQQNGMTAHLFSFAKVMTTTAHKTTTRSLATKTLFLHFAASCRSCDEEVDFVRNKCIPGAFAYNDLSHCWAISVTHAIEVEYTIKTGKRVRLSVQELIDNCFQDHRGWSRPDIAYSCAIRYGLYKYEDYSTKRKVIDACSYEY